MPIASPGNKTESFLQVLFPSEVTGIATQKFYGTLKRKKEKRKKRKRKKKREKKEKEQKGTKKGSHHPSQ